MHDNLKKMLRSFSIELPIYICLVGAYAFFIVHFLSDWLLQLFKAERKIYAVVAIGLIVTQGFILEILSRGLLGLIRGKKEK